MLGAALPFAATRAMTRFLNHADIPFPALIETDGKQRERRMKKLRSL